MKKLILASLLGFACLGAHAEAVLSCDEINELGEALGGFVDALDSGIEIGESSEDNQALHDIIVGLAEVAEAENDEDLANASLGMAEAWEANDRDAFTDALEDAVVKLAVVINTECE